MSLSTGQVNPTVWLQISKRCRETAQCIHKGLLARPDLSDCPIRTATGHVCTFVLWVVLMWDNVYLTASILAGSPGFTTEASCTNQERKCEMNKMNMPGFTADASLYKTGKFYRSAATYFSDSLGVSADSFAVVQPQLRKTDYECVHDCIEAGGTDICNFFCTEEVEEGRGGGGGEQCRPECGPCQPDPGSPMGGFRTCVKHNCDTYDKPCRASGFARPI
jgi:hypothetical protein